MQQCTVCDSDAIALRKEWCQCRVCSTRFLGEVILPDRAIVENGLVYVKRKDTESKRREMYDLMSYHPESAEELIQRAKRTRNILEANIGPTFVGDIRGTSTIESRRGSVLLIPNHYLPPRMWRMWKRREMSALEAYGAAMYVYFTKNQWMLWGSCTNFRVEFVSGSSKIRYGREALLRCDSRIKAVLDYGLIEEGRFADVPGVDYELEKTARHHQGKEILTTNLRKFARISKLSP